MTDKLILAWALFRASDWREWICTRTHLLHRLYRHALDARRQGSAGCHAARSGGAVTGAEGGEA